MAVVLFLKAPVRGAVKTRLASKIGEKATLEIYRHFVKNTLSMISLTGLTVRPYFYPIDQKEITQELLGDDSNCFLKKVTIWGKE